MRLQKWLYAAPLRLRSLFRRRAVELELDEEMQYHLDRTVEGLVAGGMPPGEARLAALRSMDGLTQRKEECRDARGLNFIDNTVQDVRYALRVLAKSRGFAVVAVLTLALAIGANAVAFGILNGLILRPLNVPAAWNLYCTEYGGNSAWQSYPNYRDLRERNRSFEDLAAFNFVFAGIDTGGDPVRSTGFATTGNYFDVLRIRPFLGRFYSERDEQGPGSAPYMVLNYAYWHRRFQDDRGVIGRVIRINRHPFTVIGVTPPDFRGTLLFVAPDFYMPIVNQAQVYEGFDLNARGNATGLFECFGHLRRGVTPQQASADVYSVGEQLLKAFPKDFGKNRSNLSLAGLTSFGGPARAFVAVLMLLAGLILLAACANLGTLFGAHTADRSREVALRLALGSSRARILRQLLTEALLISLAGSAIGLAISLALLTKLSAWQPFPSAPIHVPVNPDASVYLVALGLALVSGILFGIVPLRQVWRADPYQIVKAGPSGVVGRRRISAREVALAFQIAICAVLVTSSMVALRGLANSLKGNFGFEPRNTVLVGLNLTTGGYTGEAVPAMEKRMIEAMRAISGVEHAGLVNSYPPLVYTAAFRTSIFRDETRELTQANAALSPYQYEVSPEYFAAASTSLLAGRDFNWHDDKGAPAVVIVNREMAARFLGSVLGALGRYFRLQDGTRVQVVGVVETGKYLALTENPQPAMFRPFLQDPKPQAYLVMRSRRDPQELSAAIRGRLRDLDRGIPLDTQTWSELLDVVMFPARVATVALGVLGAIGAMLSVTGIFGMAAYSVSRRLKELGIRLALGARRTEVLNAALGRAFRLLAFGSAGGLLLGILASRVLAYVVYQATSRDPLVLAGVVVAMGLVGLVATWLPAQRALSLEPLTLLREE